MTITEMLSRLPPRAVDSLAEIARATLEASEDEHANVLRREFGNVAPILSNIETYWYIEIVRALTGEDACMEVLLYDSTGHR